MAFTAELQLAFKDNVSGRLKSLMHTGRTTARGIEKAWKKTAKNIRKNMDEASEGIKKGQDRMRTGAVNIATGGAMIAPFVLAAKAAGEYERGMSKLGNLAGQNAEQINAAYGDIIDQASISSARNVAEIQDALFTGWSGGVSKTKAVTTDFLNAVSSGSVAANADFGLIGETLTKTNLAFSDSGLSFVQMMDQISVAADGSITDIEGFSSAWQQSAASAGQLGLPIQESISALSLLTGTTKSASEASTRLNALFNAMKIVTPQAAKEYKKIGLDMSKAAIKSRGFEGTLSAITEKVKAYTSVEKEREEIFGKIFSSVEANSAFTELAIKNTENWTAAIENQNKAHGDTESKADRMASGALFKYEQAVQRVKGAWREFGVTVTPILSDVFEKLGPIVKESANWIKENKDLVHWIGKFVVALAIAKIALGGMQIIHGYVIVIGSLATAYKKITAAQWAWNAAILANPIAWFIVLGAALVAAIVWAALNFEEFTANLKAQWAGLVVAWQAAKATFWSVVEGIIDAFSRLYNMVADNPIEVNIYTNTKQALKDLEQSKKEYNTARDIAVEASAKGEFGGVQRGMVGGKKKGASTETSNQTPVSDASTTINNYSFEGNPEEMMTQMTALSDRKERTKTRQKRSLKR